MKQHNNWKKKLVLIAVLVMLFIILLAAVVSAQTIFQKMGSGVKNWWGSAKETLADVKTKSTAIGSGFSEFWGHLKDDWTLFAGTYLFLIALAKLLLPKLVKSEKALGWGTWLGPLAIMFMFSFTAAGATTLKFSSDVLAGNWVLLIGACVIYTGFASLLYPDKLRGDTGAFLEVAWPASAWVGLILLKFQWAKTLMQQNPGWSFIIFGIGFMGTTILILFLRKKTTGITAMGERL